MMATIEAGFDGNDYAFQSGVINVVSHVSLQIEPSHWLDKIAARDARITTRRGQEIVVREGKKTYKQFDKEEFDFAETHTKKLLSTNGVIAEDYARSFSLMRSLDKALKELTEPIKRRHFEMYQSGMVTCESCDHFFRGDCSSIDCSFKVQGVPPHTLTMKEGLAYEKQSAQPTPVESATSDTDDSLLQNLVGDLKQHMDSVNRFIQGVQSNPSAPVDSFYQSQRDQRPAVRNHELRLGQADSAGHAVVATRPAHQTKRKLRSVRMRQVYT